MSTTYTTYPPQPGTTTVIVKEEPSAMRKAIPQMPVWLAVICLILNIFVPGFGTIVAGFCVFAPCTNVGADNVDNVATFCVNFFVGAAQLLTCWIFFLGWIWSILWGVAFMAMSGDGPETTVITTTHAQPQPAAVVTVSA